MTIAAGTYPYKAPPKNASSDLNHLKEMVTVVQNLYDGKLQCTGQFTLATSTTTTTVLEPRCTQQSVVLLSPLTANAKTHDIHTYVSDYSEGSFTVTTNSHSSTNRTYRYVCIG